MTQKELVAMKREAVCEFFHSKAHAALLSIAGIINAPYAYNEFPLRIRDIRRLADRAEQLWGLMLIERDAMADAMLKAREAKR